MRKHVSSRLVGPFVFYEDIMVLTPYSVGPGIHHLDLEMVSNTIKENKGCVK